MKKRGRGVACMMYSIGATSMANPSAAFVQVNTDGTVRVLSGGTDLGQGLCTVMCQIAAEELGVPFENVEIVTADSDTTPYDFGSGASRATYATGNAVRLAAAAAKRLLFEAAAKRLSASVESLESSDGFIYVKGVPQKRISVAEAAQISQWTYGRPVVATDSYNPPNTPLDLETGRGDPFPSYVYATHIAEVEVDTETGEVKVLNFVAAHDVGKAVNPALVENQIYSGVSFGMGYALTEDIKIDGKGRVLNPNFSDYIIPTVADMPNIQAIIVEKYEPTGPFGAKGCGEPPNVATAPAIINAIYDAIGVRIDRLPATPEKILKALREKEKAEKQK
jgi:CO/xanthine dehydrogenase Mo-binding subunit